mgnify:CR=1 FL=1
MEVLPSAHLPSKTLIFKDDRTGSAERNLAAEKCGKKYEKYDYDVEEIVRTEKDTLVEQLREAVRGREREKALELLKKGALDGLTKEQRLEIYKSLMTLRNMEIIHYLAKQEEKFSSEMLRMDFEPI